MQQSDASYELLFELHPQPMWVFDLSSHAILAVNQAAQREYGYSRDEFLELTLPDLRPAEGTHAFQKAWAEYQAQIPALREQPYCAITRHCTKDGRVLDVEISSHQVDFQGRPARLVMAQDVTARVKTEHALRASEERMQLAKAAGKFGVWDAEPRRQEAYWDQVCHEIYGLTWSGTDRLALSDWLERIHPDDLPRLQARIFQGHTDQGFRVEHRIIRPDGELRHVEVQGRVFLDPELQPERIVGVLFDITARKQAEAELRNSRDALATRHRELEALVAQLNRLTKELQAASAAKSVFLTEISHEFRTPLNSILGMMELMMGYDLPLDLHKLLRLAWQSGQALLTLIQDLLDLAKIEARQLRLEPTGFDVWELATQTAEMMAFEAQAKQLRLMTELAPDLPRWLLGDANRLRQILLNLLSNALKFTQQGQIRLSLRCTDATAEQVTIHFEVQDTGPGIAPEEQANIFEAFVQAKAAACQGTGLGLTIARELAQLMGGDLTLTSTPGQGSCFCLSVPLHLAPEPQALTPADRSQSLRAAEILLVDDNPVSQVVVMQTLSQLGYRVTLAANGREALELLSEQAFALVLMDCQMPEMDGLTASRRIRERQGECSAADIPIIALTAQVNADTRAACLAAGMNDFLSKPFTQEALEAVVNRWLD